MSLGDFAVGATIDFHFTTRDFDTGAPQTLGGTPVLSAYEDNSLTQITAGITLTADFDAITGLNHVRIVATGANGYEAGKSYSVVITTGTVDTVSVVGEVVGYFTLERSAAFTRLGAPAGASVSADIAAIEAQTDDIGVAGAGLSAVPWNAAWDAEVQSEVADALDVTTYAEPSSVPAATSSLKDKITWLFTLARHKVTQTSTTQTLRNDADTATIATATVSDDGVTATRNEWT